MPPVKPEKTNVMRIVEAAQINHQIHTYNLPGATGADIAAYLKQDPDHVFKTLVTVGKTGKHYVFVIPVKCELDLKKAAAASNEKYIEMIKQKDLLPLTGYVHGGCSPIGMKKQFDTFIDETAQLFDTIVFSAGKIGFQVEMDPNDLTKIIEFTYCDLTI